MPRSSPWLLRSWTFPLAGVPARLGIAGLAIPVMLFSVLGNLPARIDLPLVGVRTRGETMALVVAAVTALYAQELLMVAGSAVVVAKLVGQGRHPVTVTRPLPPGGSGITVRGAQRVLSCRVSSVREVAVGPGGGGHPPAAPCPLPRRL